HHHGFAYCRTRRVKSEINTAANMVPQGLHAAVEVVLVSSRDHFKATGDAAERADAGEIGVELAIVRARQDRARHWRQPQIGANTIAGLEGWLKRHEETRSPDRDGPRTLQRLDIGNDDPAPGLIGR